MADSKELASQLKIQQDINKVLQARQATLNANQKNLSAQAAIAQELCDALACKNLEGMADRLAEIQAGLEESANKAKELADPIDDADDGLKKAAGSAKSLTEMFEDMVEELGAAGAAMVGFASGAAQGFKGAIADIQMMGAALSGIAGVAMSVGKSILSIPFSMFGALGQMSADAAGGGGGGASALKVAMEEVRGEYGSFATGEGKAVMDAYADLTAEGSALTDTGLSMSQMFKDQGEALKAVGEFAKAAGAEFHMLKDSFAENASMLVAMNKGLGMTEEALMEVTKQAQLAGKDVGSELLKITSMTISMEKQFGVSGKTIGKNFSALAKDVKTFSGLSNKELIATATYMAKLGLEAKDLQGIVGKTDDFESAAEAVSQLNQAFGVQIDTMELMNADPAEKVELMRKAFDEAGKSIDDMTRQEKALLAEQTGMEVSALESALAQENMGTSLEDVEAGADAAEAQTLSQAEAMNHLADSIERVTGGGGGSADAFSSLFDALIGGFIKGFTSGKKFGQLLEQIQAVFQEVAIFGAELGKMFYDLVDKMGLFDALKDIFEIGAIKKLLGKDGILGLFKKFFDALTGKGEYSPAQLADDLGDQFSEFFSSKGPAFQKLKTAMIKGIEMIGGIIQSLIPWVVGKIAEMISGIADFIRDPSALQEAGEQGIGGAIMGAIGGAAQALLDAAPMLLDAMLDLLSAVFEQHGGKIIAIGAALVGYIFLKMMVVGAIQAAKAALFQVVVQKLTKLMGGVVEGAGETAKNGEGAKSMGEALKEGFTGAAEGLKGFINKIAEIKPGQIMKAMLNMALIALSFVPAMVIFAFGLVAVALVISLVPFGTVIKGLTALALAVPVVAMMILMAQLMQPGAVPTAILGLLAGALLLVVGGVAFTLALGVIGATVGAVGIGTILASVVGLVALAVGAFAVAQALPFFAAVGSLVGLVGLAIVGMIAGAVMLTIGASAFILGLGLVGSLVQGIGVSVFLAAAVGMVALAVAAGALTLAAMALSYGIPFFIPGMVGSVLGAVFLAAAIPFVLAVGLMGTFIMTMPLKEIAKGMVALVIMAGATAMVALILGYAIPAFVLGMVGAVLAAAFFGVLGLVTFPAINYMIGTMPEDLAGSAAKMVTMIIFMAAAGATAYVTGVFAIAFIAGAIGALTATAFFLAMGVMLPHMDAAMLKAPDDMVGGAAKMILMAVMMGAAGLTAVAMSYGIPYFLVGSLGAFAAIPFFIALGQLMPHINEFASAMDMGVLKNASRAMVMLAAMFFVTVAMAIVSLLMVVFLNPIVMWLAKKGLGIVGELFTTIATKLAPGLKMLDNMKIKDPAGLEAKVSALGKIFEAMSGLGDIIVAIAGLQVLNSATGGEGDLLKSASKFLDSMLGGAKKLIVVLVKMTKSMDEGSIKKLEAIAGVLSAIANLMSALQPPPGLFEAIAEMSSGGFFGGGQDVDVEGILKAYAEQAQMMMNAMKESVVSMMKELLKIDIGPDPELAKTKAEVIATAIGAVVDMASGFGEMAAGVMAMNQEEQGFFGSGESVKETLKSYMMVMDMIMGAVAKNVPIVLKAILGVQIDDPAGAKAKLEVISLAMSALSDFASAIATFSDLIPPSSDSWWPFGEETDPLDEFMATVDAIVGVSLKWIPKIVNSLLSIDVPSGPESKAKLDIISMSMAVLADFSGTIGGIADTFGMGAANIYESLGGTLKGIAWIMGFESDNTGKTLPELMTVMAEMQLPDAGTIEANVTTLGAGLTALTTIGETISSLQEAFSGIASDDGLGIATVVEGAIQEVKALQDAFSTMGEIDLQAGLDQFAAAVAVGNTQMMIENSPLNITINLNVTMDANKVGRVLVDKSVMSTPLATADNA